MQLTTDYREEKVGTLTGNKDHFLVCTVDFSDQERAIIQERGLYDQSIELPAEKGLPTRASAYGSRAMVIAGMLIGAFGLLGSCSTIVTSGRGPGTGPATFVILIVGVILFIIGKYRQREANRIEDNPTQTLTVGRLLTEPTFLVYAYSPLEAQQYEEEVRSTLGQLAQYIRDSAPVQERNRYEL